MAFNARRFAKDIAIYGLGRIAGALVPLVTLPILTRMLSTAQFGIIDLMLGFATLMGTLLTTGLVGAYSYHIVAHETAEERRSLTMAVVHWHIAWSLVLLPLVWLVAPSLLANLIGERVAADILALVLLIVLLQQLLSFTITILRMDGRAWTVVALNALTNFSAAMCAIAMILITDLALTAYFIGYAGGLFLGTAAGLFLIRRDLAWHRPQTDQIGPLLVLGLPLMLGTMAEAALSFADRAIIAGNLSVGQLGIYAVGARIASLAAIGTQSISFAFLPFAMRLIRDPERDIVSTHLDAVWRATTLLLLAGAICGGYLAPLIVQLLAPPSYSEAAVVIPLLMLGHVFYGYTYFTYLGTLRAERTSLYTLSVAIGVAINIASALVLVPLIGTVGAASATVIGMAATPVASFWFSQRVWPLRLPGRRIVAMSIVAILANTALAHLNCKYPLSLVGAAVVVVAVLLVGFFGLRRGDLGRLMALVSLAKS